MIVKPDLLTMKKPQSAFTVGMTVVATWLVIVAPSEILATESVHVPKPLNIEADLTEEKLQIEYLIDRYLFLHWTGLDAQEFPFLEDDDFDTACDRIADFLLANAPLAIDGIDVRPIVDDLEFQEAGQGNDFTDYVLVLARYGVKGIPQQIEFNWLRYDTEDNYPLDAAFLIFAARDDFQIFKLREDDPTKLWVKEGARTVVNPDSFAPGIITSSNWRLPKPQNWMFVIFALSGAALLKLRFRSLHIVLVGGFAFIFWMVSFMVYFAAAHMEFSGSKRIILPREEKAIALFETLHRNIYRAFDYQDEIEIYDALARSLTPELIDSVYGEIYRSMKMQLELETEEIACTIRSVRLLETTPEFPEAPKKARFSVLARWQVIGTVRHWGHGHWRTNGYEARYQVRWSETDGWRIASVEILGQDRVDDGRETAP